MECVLFARLSQINYGKCWCALDATNTRSYAASFERLDNYPLIELPPHGRIIDKDKLRRELFVNFDGQRIPFYDCDNFPTKIAYRDLHSILAEQKTIIEAEGETK